MKKLQKYHIYFAIMLFLTTHFPKTVLFLEKVFTCVAEKLSKSPHNKKP